MSDIPPITYVRRVAESPGWKATHIVATILSALCLPIAGFYARGLITEIERQGDDIAEINARLSAIATYERRIEVLETWKQSTDDDIRRRPRFDLSDAKEMRAEINGRIVRIEDRVTVLERRR